MCMARPERDRDVLEVLFPVVRARLLRLFLSAPPKHFYVRELMGKTELALHTIQDELRKLTAIGLLTSWSNGFHRFYRVQRDHVLFSHLRSMVQAAAELPKPRPSALRRETRKGAVRKQTGRKSPSLPLDRPRYRRVQSGRSKT